MMRGMKLLIHFQTSMLQPLKFGLAIPPHTLLGMWSFIHARITVISMLVKGVLGFSWFHRYHSGLHDWVGTTNHTIGGVWEVMLKHAVGFITWTHNNWQYNRNNKSATQQCIYSWDTVYEYTWSKLFEKNNFVQLTCAKI